MPSRRDAETGRDDEPRERYRDDGRPREERVVAGEELAEDRRAEEIPCAP